MSTSLIIGSFFAGVFTVLAPCMLALLPVILGTCAGSKSSLKPFIVTASLGVSVIVFTLLLKVSTVFIDIPQIYWSIASGAIIAVFGLVLLFPNLWDAVSEKLGLHHHSSAWLNKAGDDESIWGAVLVGAALGPVFTSCSPTYFIILATVLPASFAAGVAYLMIYVFGLSLMLGLIGYLGQKIVKKLHWAVNPQGLFKRSMGVLLVVVGLLIMTEYNKLVEAKILSTGYDTSFLEQKIVDHRTQPADVMSSTVPAEEKYQDYTMDNVTQAQQAGKNYALFFHADWCSTCTKLEKEILENARELPSNSVIFKVNYDKESALKKEYRVLTQTTVLFFDSHGNLVDRKINPNMQRITHSLSVAKGEKMKPKDMSKDKASVKALKEKKASFDNAPAYFKFLEKQKSLKQAVFAGGCFWCIEGPFEAEAGVVEAFSGFSGGSHYSPSYEDVTSGNTGAREAVVIFYDPEVIAYADLLEIYWRQIDPTDAGGQFADRGHHYTTAIYYHDQQEQQTINNSIQTLKDSGQFSAIATKVIPFERFHLAEAYHQDYYMKSAEHYQRYKEGSGRAKMIKRNAPIMDDVFNKKDVDKTYSKPGEQSIKAMLSDEAYAVTQEGATERPFANAFWDHHEPGIYVDVVTGEPLFSSTDKFESGTGWPSFTRPIDDNFITKHVDNKLAMTRTEVKSKVGDSHLGHVFNDGPKDKGGMRYCINSSALRFVPVAMLEKEGYGKYMALFGGKGN